MDPAEEKRRSREAWNAVAQRWAELADDPEGPQTTPISVWMVDAIRPQPGHTVVELAAGPASVGLLAAEQVQPGGEVICTDFSPDMVEAGRKLAEGRGLSNIRFRQEDAQSLTFDAASADGVLCRFGYMLMPDAGAALRETRRILRAGARVALAVWKGPEENPWMSLIGGELARRGWVDPPVPGTPGPFTWAAEDVAAEHLRDAGFVELEVEPLDIEAPYDSFDSWLSYTASISANFRNAVAERGQEEVEDLREALRDASRPYLRDDGSLLFPGNAWVAWASA